MTVYIDSLFMSNLFMDSVIIFIVSVMRRRAISTKRLFVASAVSALYGSLIFFPDLAFIYGALAKIIFSVIPVIIAIKPKGIKDFLVSFAVFWLITTALGGIIFAISTMSDFGFAMQTMTSNFVMYTAMSPLVMLVGCVLLYILTEIYRRMCIKTFTTDEMIVELDVKYEGKSFALTALIDTGCELYEPLSCAPMIVAEKSVFTGIVEPISYIKISTASGEGKLKMILPDSVICKNNKYEFSADTAIALTEEKISDYGVYNAVINPAALNYISNKSNVRCVK